MKTGWDDTIIMSVIITIAWKDYSLKKRNAF